MPKTARPRKSKGSLIAECLAGAWRQDPQSLNITPQELEEAAPLLLGSGEAALAWRRIRQAEHLLRAPAAEELERAYQRNVIQATFQERQIEKVFSLLRAGGVEAMLVKGWSLARAYPSMGMRPCGDIDLLVHPEQRERAREIFEGPEGRKYFVDFGHEEFAELDAAAWRELLARSRSVALGAEQVRMLSEEDHLRFLCIHLLRHGAWRPLWLCDVAVVLETRTRGFDWERCLGERSEREADWVACAIGLAHKLLGARIDDTPLKESARRIPNWLVSAVLKQWETPCLIDRLPPELIMVSLRHPSRVVRALKDRWPDPVEATIRMRGPMNGWPRLPYQIGGYLAKTGNFVTRLPKLVREHE
jgi:hypothetical protein